MSEPKWKVELETAAALRQAEARIADLELYSRAATSGPMRKAIELCLRLLKDTLISEIDYSRSAPGDSNLGEKWEEGYIDGMERAHWLIEAALKAFTEPNK